MTMTMTVQGARPHLRRSFSAQSRLLIATLAGLLLAGCHGSGVVEHGGSAATGPAVTAQSYHGLALELHRMDPADPARQDRRDALIAFRITEAEEALVGDDYDLLVQALAASATLLSPSDFTERNIPQSLAPLALRVRDLGRPRGDEGRVMGALLLLDAMAERSEEERQTNEAERERINAWGMEARNLITNPIERYGQLLQVWEQLEQIAPAPPVLARLAALYVEQREAIMGAMSSAGERGQSTRGLSYQQLQLAPVLAHRTPLDVASVYLRHGDLQGAIDAVAAAGGGSELDTQLTEILTRAQADGEAGAQALQDLAGGFSRARPGISAAICQLGLRLHAEDARFPLCLARAALEQERLAAAASWYGEALRLSPEDREIYDEALERIDAMRGHGLFGGSDLDRDRVIARHTLAILTEYEARWPMGSPPMSRASLLAALGGAELLAGNLDAGRAQLDASLALEPTRAAHETLGLLFERTNDPGEAGVHYRHALDLVSEEDEGGAAQRALLTERLGDTFRAQSNMQQATRMYRQAETLWQGQLRGARRRQLAFAQTRLGILQSQLGNRARSVEHLELAMGESGNWRSPYEEILSHLVVSTPDLPLAHDVLRRAQFGTTLEPQWKIYFALWVQVIGARAETPVEPEVLQLLRDFSEGDDWHAKLAAFGAGTLSGPALLAAASDLGERTEAHFYHGAQLMGAGDTEGARREFRAAIDGHMIYYYELRMAQALLRELDRPGR